MSADITVVIPAHNEGPRLAGTINSIADTRTTRAQVQIVIADDQSDDGTDEHLRAAWPALSGHPRLEVQVTRTPERYGVPRSRNWAAHSATGDILFITDAHVRFPHGWDATALQHVRPDRILAGAIGEASSSFIGYGCRLVVPFMGTYWNKDPVTRPTPVQIAPCPATVLPRELFERLGGYDDGMIMYGAAEPEFSVRAWLAGAEIVLVPNLLVHHVFKPQDERVTFIRSVRQNMVANGLRFGLLYASDAGAMQLLRYYALKFPNLFQQALAEVEQSDLWERRAQLEAELKHPFAWFVERFDVRDPSGAQIT